MMRLSWLKNIWGYRKMTEELLLELLEKLHGLRDRMTQQFANDFNFKRDILKRLEKLEKHQAGQIAHEVARDEREAEAIVKLLVCQKCNGQGVIEC